MKNLYFEKNGNTWLGHIIGTEQEIELTHNSLFNNCGTDTRTLDFVDANHATFWTTQASMERYLVNRNLNIILNETPDKFKRQAGGALVEARRLAAEQFSQLNFDAVPRSFAAQHHDYAYQEAKEVQKVEDLHSHLVRLARGV